MIVSARVMNLVLRIFVILVSIKLGSMLNLWKVHKKTNRSYLYFHHSSHCNQ